MKSIRNRMKYKQKLIHEAEQVVSGKVSIRGWESAMLKNSAIQERQLTPKGQTICAQVIELQQFKYDKIQVGDPRIVSDKWVEETSCQLFYKYKDKLPN